MALGAEDAAQEGHPDHQARRLRRDPGHVERGGMALITRGIYFKRNHLSLRIRVKKNLIEFPPYLLKNLKEFGGIY